MSDKEKDKDKKKEPSGIISCQYSVGGVDKGTINNGDTIFMETNKVHRFYLDPAKGDFGAGTKDKQASANEGKWAYLMNYLWDKAIGIKGKEVYPLWGDIGSLTENEPIPHLGIGNQYKLGSFMEFAPEANDFWVGNHYRMEVFNNVPNKGFHFNFFPVEKPSIKFAYFDEQKIEPLADGLGINDGLYYYSQTVDLHMFTHLLPARFEDKYRIATETSYEDLMLEVILVDKDGKELQKDPIIKEKLSKFYVSENGTAANAEFKIPFYIDPKWKDTIHFKSEEMKEYSAILYIKNTKTKAEYSIVLATTAVNSFNETTKELEARKVSRYISVKYETAAVILSNLEIHKKNQVQLIGDVATSHKEYDPCGYSKITLREEKGTRIPFDIFDEDARDIDRTTSYFDIITGDQEKGVIIELGNLHNKGVMCTGVLLENGKTHSDIHNVFQMHTVVQRFKNAEGKYVVVVDKTHEKQLKKAGIKVTDENKTDYDYKADPEKKSEDVARSQNLIEGKDFSYVGDNLKLTPHYYYNKTFDSHVTEFLGVEGRTVLDKKVDNFWAFKYFFLSEDMAQKYFVPVSTCRYPNQLARIRVFPDIKWELYVLIMPVNATESYAPTNMPTNKDSFGDPKGPDVENKKKSIFEIHQKKAREAGVNAKKFDKEYTGEFHIKASISNSKDGFDLGLGIQNKIQKVLSKLTTLKEGLDSLSHRNSAQKGGNAQSAMKLVKSTKMTLPVFIEFSLPTLRIGGGWNYDIPNPNDGLVKCVGNLQYGFEPLVQAKGGIDLIAAAEFIPPVRAVLTALRYVKVGAQWLSDKTPVKLDAELYFNLYAKGKVDIRQTIDFINSVNDKFDVKASLLLGIELGFKIKAVIEKVIFTNGKDEIIKVAGLDGQLSAEAESGFVVNATAGSDPKGMYVEGKLDFTGVTLKIVGKLSIYKPGKKPKVYNLNDKFGLVDYVPNIIKERYYVL